MSLQPRPEVERIAPGIHGGPDHAELQTLGLSLDRVLDFSVCCNPYPPPRRVRESLRGMALHRYPDSNAADLCRKLAEKLGLDSVNILAGNGTTELIRLIALTYFRNGDKVMIFRPAYGEYSLASRIAGAEVIVYQGQASENYRLTAEKFAQAVRQRRPKAVFICNPNNPTGQYLSGPEIDLILRSCEDCLLVLDEAYVNFVDRPWSSLELLQRGNVIILRSMTKDYGLAGLRLGYMAASPPIIDAVRRVCPPWNVNIAAQKAGAAALECDGFLRESQRRVREAGRYLFRELSRSGFSPLPSEANFFLLKAGDGRRFRQVLLEQGLLVRDCASFGLPEYIRIAPRTMKDCRKLIGIIRKLKKEGAINVGSINPDPK